MIALALVMGLLLGSALGDMDCVRKTCESATGLAEGECDTDCKAAGYPSGTCVVTSPDNGNTVISNCTCNGVRDPNVVDVEEGLCVETGQSPLCKPTCGPCGYDSAVCHQNPSKNGGGCICSKPAPPSSLWGLLGRLLGGLLG